MDLPKMTKLESVQNNLNAQLVRISYLESKITKLEQFQNFFQNVEGLVNITRQDQTCSLRGK